MKFILPFTSAPLLIGCVVGCASPQERFKTNRMRAYAGDETARVEVAWAYLRGIGTEKNVEKGLSVLDTARAAGVSEAADKLTDWVYAVLWHAELDDLPLAMSRLDDAYALRLLVEYDSSGNSHVRGTTRIDTMDDLLVPASVKTVEALLAKDDLASALAVRNCMREASFRHNGKAERLGTGERFVLNKPGDLLVHHETIVRDPETDRPVPEFFKSAMDSIETLVRAACERIALRAFETEQEETKPVPRSESRTAIGKTAEGPATNNPPLEEASIQTIRASGTGMTVQEAKAEALREAVEKVVGECVSGIVEVENDELILDKTERLSSGALDGWMVVEEPVPTQDGLVRIVLDVRVRERFLRDVSADKKKSSKVAVPKGILGQSARLHDRITAIREKAEADALSVPNRWRAIAADRMLAADAERRAEASTKTESALDALERLLGPELQKLVYCTVCKNADGTPVVFVEKIGAVSVDVALGVSLEEYEKWEKRLERALADLRRDDARTSVRVVFQIPSKTFDPHGKKRSAAIDSEAARYFAGARIDVKAVVAIFDADGTEIARREMSFPDAIPHPVENQTGSRGWEWVVSERAGIYYIAPGSFDASCYEKIPVEYLSPYPFANKWSRTIMFQSLSLDDIRRIETVRAWTESLTAPQ